MRAAALKLLCHVYLLGTSGNRQIWLHSLPTDFKQWATDELNACGTDDDVKQLLKSSTERFSTIQKQHFAAAGKHGLAWCQKTGIVLAEAVGGDPPAPARTRARALAKRWFADPAVTESGLDASSLP